MPEHPDDIEPCAVLSMALVVTGGRLPNGKSAVLRLVSVRGVDFWKVLTTDTDTCMLLSGKPACYRPLSKVKVLKFLLGLLEARRRELSQEAEKLLDLDLPDTLGLNVADEPSPPVKKRKTLSSSIHPMLTIEVPKKYPEDDAKMTMRILNCDRSISMEATTENIDWLVKACDHDLQ
jgi:hypothetical protein